MNDTWRQWKEWEEERRQWREEFYARAKQFKPVMDYPYREAEYVAGRCRHVDDPLFGKPVEKPLLLEEMDKTR